MSTYEIIPDTSSAAPLLVSVTNVGPNNISAKKCKELCNNDSDCVAFTYSSENGCHLRARQGPTYFQQGITLYNKNARSSFWMVWIALLVIGIVVFVVMCK